MTKGPGFTIIVPPNTLKLKAERPGGITRGQAAEIAASAIAHAASEYRAISLRDVEDLESLAADLWRAGSDDAAPRRLLYRKAHDLWSLGDTFGYPLVTEVSGGLCAYVGAVGESDRLDRAVVTLHIQALRMIVGGRMTGAGDAAVRDMVDGLSRAVAKVVGRRPA